MLSINKIVYNALSGSTELNNLISTNYFPIVAPEKTELPFIVYKRTSYTSTYTKDSCTNNNMNIEFNCVTTTYGQGLDIIEILRNIFESKRFNNNTIRFTINSASEDYDGSFIQTITFDVAHINN